MNYKAWQIRDMMMLALDQASQHTIQCDVYHNEGPGLDPNECGFIAVCEDGSSFKVSTVPSVAQKSKP